MTKNNSGFSKYIMSLLLFLLFEAVAVTLWLTKDNLFYLLNFSYIGCLPRIGHGAVHCRETLCQAFCATGSRMLYVAVSRRDLP